MYVALYSALLRRVKPELYLTECVPQHDISSKADRGDIFIIHDQKSSYRTPLG